MPPGIDGGTDPPWAFFSILRCHPKKKQKQNQTNNYTFKQKYYTFDQINGVLFFPKIIQKILNEII